MSRKSLSKGPARGYFAIGIWHPKAEENIGTLWRSAWQLGATEIFTIAERWPERQTSDTCKAWRHIPYRRYEDIDRLVSSLPYQCPLIGVEMGGKVLSEFNHPERACYLLGAEDKGLPDDVLAKCRSVVSLPSVRTPSYNVAVAGSLVMYDRLTKGRTAVRSIDMEDITATLKAAMAARGKVQRDIEKAHGWSRGYLSQVFQGRITMTMAHVLAVLSSLDIGVQDFFASANVLRDSGLLGPGGQSSSPGTGRLEPPSQH